jgi:hypothetical protein
MAPRLTAKLYWNDRDCKQRNWFVCQTRGQGTGNLNLLKYKSFKVAENSDSPSLTTWPKAVNLITPHSSYQLQSPLYPLEYPNMMDQEIIFTSPPGTTIVIEFAFFNLENETSCSYDRLTISEPVIGL